MVHHLCAGEQASSLHRPHRHLECRCISFTFQAPVTPARRQIELAHAQHDVAACIRLSPFSSNLHNWRISAEGRPNRDAVPVEERTGETLLMPGRRSRRAGERDAQFEHLPKITIQAG
jgi:hypothetical protein